MMPALLRMQLNVGLLSTKSQIAHLLMKDANPERLSYKNK